MFKNKKLRVARPSLDLNAVEKFYCDALGLQVLGRFDDHLGFDGIMVGHPECSYHFEFTRQRSATVLPSSTSEDLIVFYIPEVAEWEKVTKSLAEHGFKLVTSHNPYWDKKGRTYLDPDGYRVVLQNAAWA